MSTCLSILFVLLTLCFLSFRKECGVLAFIFGAFAFVICLLFPATEFKEVPITIPMKIVEFDGGVILIEKIGSQIRETETDFSPDQMKDLVIKQYVSRSLFGIDIDHSKVELK